ncbi:GDP-L-fucose synthase family protein [Cupriavidus campinensis]|uniref:GDP-L-fucose synthase n=1 Tax=Cupriavidus campinensis TaxID=151783 RepID=A0ABY3EN66_9BURK|nr:GDP-L-fucose synthase [Cupriavidus campinensis]TSP12404.1 GDP-L-fucose synthase [Cupriavidus campinensis]
MIVSGPILITGGTGMVGRNLLDLAKARQIDVVAPSSRELDLRNFDAVRGFLRELQPACVVHAAGRVGGIQANIREPVAFLVENWDMGRNLLMAAREAGVQRVMNLGSSCMYPRNSPNALREEEVLTGQLEPTNEGYAIAKCAVARLCDYINRESPECHYKTLIPCNLYGKYDKFDPQHSHLVPAIIHKVHEAKTSGRQEVDIWGDGKARREFLYATDLADAILVLAERFDELPGLLNIGLGRDYEVNEYYQAAAEVVGYSGRFVHDLSKPVGMSRKLVDIGRATELGWVAKTSLVDGLRATYDYYLNQLG